MYSVFLVDDEELVIKSLNASVEWNKHGFDVVGYALSGGEAIEKIEKLKPAVVFTDIQMPGMNGLELIKRVKKEMPDVVCIVISGYAEFAYAQKAINYGAFGYCLKPFDEDEIGGYLVKAKAVLDKLQKTVETDMRDLMIEDSEEARRLIEERHRRRQELNVTKYSSHTFNTILKYVNENFLKDISTHSISKELNVNASYISQLFKKEVGITFTDYLTKLRVDLACDFLKTTDLSINEIAEKSGYNDYFYFSRIFKKVMGMTPSAYRSQNVN